MTYHFYNDPIIVIPATAGIQLLSLCHDIKLDSRLRGNDDSLESSIGKNLLL